MAIFEVILSSAGNRLKEEITLKNGHVCPPITTTTESKTTKVAEDAVRIVCSGCVQARGDRILRSDVVDDFRSDFGGSEKSTPASNRLVSGAVR